MTTILVAITIVRTSTTRIVAQLALASAAFVLFTACENLPAPTPTNVPVPIDRAALVALYNATGGPNWEYNTNWMSDKPLEEWLGVTMDHTGRVTELRINRNNLSGQIPTELGNLNNLKVLTLTENRLTGTIPAQLGNLQNLKDLYLWGNRLSGQIPPELGNLSNLEWLTLSENRLTGTIPVQLGNLQNLIVLDIANNQLTGCIPVGLRRVPDNDFSVSGLPFCTE